MTPSQQRTAAPALPLNTANSGFIVHRTGQLEYGFAAEGEKFAADLVSYMNRAQGETVSTYAFREVLGVHDRLHWFVHMRSPHDYQRLLNLVDHDRDYQQISTVDRLPTNGGGNWERMFTPGSFSEQVLCPQHGFAHPPAGAVDPAVFFAEPARYQTEQPVEVQLHSGNAGAIIFRTGKAKYELRDQGRAFWIEWAGHINSALPGVATVLLYEQIFGRQDTIHLMIHLRGLSDYHAIEDIERQDHRMRELLTVQRVPDARGGGSWGDLFVPGSLHDCVLLPMVTRDQEVHERRH
jgi:hypothetical protein